MSILTLSFVLSVVLAIVKLAFSLSGSWFWICFPFVLILSIILILKIMVGIGILIWKTHDKIHKTNSYELHKNLRELNKSLAKFGHR